jgi:glycosyltransferase involved in cell wall biosynthesis
MHKNKTKLLIYIITYNHEDFITNVLKRIPLESLAKKYEIEVLLNDDASSDNTVEESYKFKNNIPSIVKFKILRNPINQGYGGNQKIGYHYAIKNKFDIVALLHGDGQYAPEYLNKLVEPLDNKNIDAVFGSRMMTKGTAKKGGMPLYKLIGNKVITFYQNLLLSTQLSEFHSGYRAYRVSSLNKIPFYLNTSDYPFDTEIIIQFVIAKMKIFEIPIPTYYGFEWHANHIMYAIQVCVATLRAKFHILGFINNKKYNCENKESYINSSKENIELKELLSKAKSSVDTKLLD